MDLLTNGQRQLVEKQIRLFIMGFWKLMGQMDSELSQFFQGLQEHVYIRKEPYQ